ncbi:MAG TPA: glycosyltransferase family 2 protein, partial [Chloroflexota bacterium]
PELIPDFWAANDQVLAFRRRGPVLSIALMNGKDELPAGLEALTGCAIEPVLGVAGDVEETFARWYRDAPAAASAEQAGFGEFLVRAGILTQAQFDADWRTSTQLARPLDAVLAARIGWDELARQVAVFLELKIVQLDLVSETHEHVDALGRLRRDTRQRDPVDAEIARRLSKDLALRARALPVARKSTTVIVAMVNPLNASDVQEIQAELGGNVQLCVAESSQMERAQRRVWSTASLGESMVLAGLIEPEDLRRAMKVHDATGVRLGQALLSLGLVTANDLAYFLAKQTGVPFFDLSGTIADPKVAGLMKPPTSGRARYLPLYQEVDGGVLLAVPDPMTPEELATARDELGIPDARQVIVTEYAFDEALDAVYRDDFHEHSASELMTREPDQSARWVLSLGQKAFLAGLVVALGAGFAVAPVATGTALMALATFFYVGFSVYKFFLAYSAMAHTLEIGTDDEEVQSLDDRFLPIYTILVPLYKESEVLPGLIKAIDRLDYPKAKLDVKLLLEEDDEETIAVARASGLPSHFKLVVVPRGLPKGKPKACNYGLIYARGEYAVIFDAEDLPERDQLKKAIVAFNKAPDEVACIQAKLNYFNRDQNLLTRWFTTEYSMWFDLFLPGLDASHAPIPLGGTSNHFRTARLRELGAWDPYNVTEDADLGVRLFKAGMKTAVIDSTTYEEANSEIYNWIRQRSRWVKGYIQTYLVHMRHPLRLIRQLGLKDFFSFQMVVGGTFFGFLANPVFWVITAGWYLFQWGWIKPLFPPLLFYLGAFNLYIGNFAFTYLNVAGCLRRRYYDMVKYALMTPIYWALMSIAAWKGFLQLFYAPSYWEKTKHGLYQGIIQAEPDKRELAA